MNIKHIYNITDLNDKIYSKSKYSNILNIRPLRRERRHSSPPCYCYRVPPL